VLEETVPTGGEPDERPHHHSPYLSSDRRQPTQESTTNRAQKEKVVCFHDFLIADQDTVGTVCKIMKTKTLGLTVKKKIFAVKRSALWGLCGCGVSYVLSRCVGYCVGPNICAPIGQNVHLSLYVYMDLNVPACLGLAKFSVASIY
jgi:hypothetical protein